MSASEDEFQPGTSSRSRSQANQQSIDGWISMATKRAKAHSSTSSTANQRVVNSRYVICLCKILKATLIIQCKRSCPQMCGSKNFHSTNHSEVIRNFEVKAKVFKGKMNYDT